MLALSLPEELDARLDELSRATGQSKAALVEEAIAAQLESLEKAELEKASLEDWLRTDGVAAYDRLKADPDRALALETVRERLAARREARSAR
jgi:predicted DNA-binding protein